MLAATLEPTRPASSKLIHGMEKNCLKYHPVHITKLKVKWLVPEGFEPSRLSSIV